jgi:hypothetical protein
MLRAMVAGDDQSSRLLLSCAMRRPALADVP